MALEKRTFSLVLQAVNLAIKLIVHYSYSLFYASRGANVVVNDVSKDAANRVVEEIVKGIIDLLLREPSLYF